MATVTQPAVLKLASLFVDGYGYAGDVDITLPTLTTKTESTHIGFGDVEIPMGINAAVLSWSMEHHDQNLMALQGIAEGGDKTVTVRGSFDHDGDTLPVVAKGRGFVKETNPGSFTPGGKAALSQQMSLREYSLTVNGTEVIGFNYDTQEFRVNGVDQMAAHRAAAGL
ncbi:MAG: phage major tail tube protein [Gammaproteobacteria bacterium]|nr:phage major tail tube protein [Gammaproteobacteria bacterium]